MVSKIKNKQESLSRTISKNGIDKILAFFIADF